MLIKYGGIILVILLMLSLLTTGCTTAKLCADKEGGCGDGSLPPNEDAAQPNEPNDNLQPPALPEE